jgi:cysteine synthase
VDNSLQSKIIGYNLAMVTPEKVHTVFQRTLQAREALAGIRPAGELKTKEDRLEQYNKLRQLIYSSTPTIKINHPNGSIVLVNYQSYRPSGSHYDPTYLETLQAMEFKYGLIKPGDDLYEVSSGSAGTSFAWLCNRLGFGPHIYVPSALPYGRIQEMVNFGADLRLVGDETAYIKEAVKKMVSDFGRAAKASGHKKEDPIVNEDFHLRVTTHPNSHKMVLVNHAENPITPRTMENMLQEVHRVIPEGTQIDNIISAIGNGSSSRGLAQARNYLFPDAKLIGLEGYNNAVLFEQKYPEEFKRLGLVYKPQQAYGSIVPGMDFPFAKPELFDEIRLVREPQMKRKMGDHNSMAPVIAWIGMTSAASLILAKQLALEQPGSVTLAFVYDNGDRYSKPVMPTGKIDATLEELNRLLYIPGVPWKQPKATNLESIPSSLMELFRR